MQAVDAGLTGVVLRWMSLRDTLVRDIHVAMHGQETVAWGAVQLASRHAAAFPRRRGIGSCGARRNELPLLHGCWDTDCSVMRGRDANLEVLPANPRRCPRRPFVPPAKATSLSSVNTSLT